MAYNIIKTNGTTLVSLNDGEVNTTVCSLALIGRNVSTYGERINDNFVRLLENAANSDAPAAPLVGQLWYDTTNKQLNYRNTTNTGWVGISSYTKGTTAPSGISNGDTWYDTTNKKLKIHIDGTDSVVGPLGNVTLSGDISGTAAYSGSANITVTASLVVDRVKKTGDTLTGQLNASAGFTAGSGTTANLIYATGTGVGILNNDPKVALDVVGAIRMVPVTDTYSSTITIDATYGNHQITLTGNTTFAISNFGNAGQTLRLVITGTNHTMTWPGNIYWPNGASPNLANGPQKIAVVTLIKPASGNLLATYVSY